MKARVVARDGARQLLTRVAPLSVADADLGGRMDAAAPSKHPKVPCLRRLNTSVGRKFTRSCQELARKSWHSCLRSVTARAMLIRRGADQPDQEWRCTRRVFAIIQNKACGWRRFDPSPLPSATSPRESILPIRLWPDFLVVFECYEGGREGLRAGLDALIPQWFL